MVATNVRVTNSVQQRRRSNQTRRQQEGNAITYVYVGNARAAIMLRKAKRARAQERVRANIGKITDQLNVRESSSNARHVRRRRNCKRASGGRTRSNGVGPRHVNARSQTGGTRHATTGKHKCNTLRYRLTRSKNGRNRQ